MKATPAQFRRDLEADKADHPVYLLHGGESFLIDQARDRLLAALSRDDSGFGLERFNAAETTPGEIVAAWQQMDVFGGDKLVVVGHLEEVTVKWLEGLIDPLADPPGASRLVLTAHGKIKANTRFYKAVDKAGQVVEFAPLNDTESGRWLKGRADELGKRLDDRAGLLLTSLAGSSLSDLNGELVKLALFVGDRTEITIDDVRQAAAQRKGYDNFALGEAVGRRDGLTALAILDQLFLGLGEGGGPLIMGLLAHKIRTLLQARSLLESGQPPDRAARSLRLPPQAAREAVSQAKNFSVPELAQRILDLHRTDLELKTGAPPRESLEGAILKICLERGV